MSTAAPSTALTTLAREIEAAQAHARRPLTPAAAGILLEQEIHAARRHAAHAKADNTQKAYRSDWQHFSDYCEKRQVASLPAEPEVIAAYLSFLADHLGYKLSTIRRRIASISQAHQYAGLETPTGSIAVRETMRGLAKDYADRTDEGKAAAVAEDIRAMVDQCPDTLKGARDRALLLMGYAGALRRSELAALNFADVDTKPRDGMILTIRQSKTNKTGEPELIAIAYAKQDKYCPVRAFKAWKKAAKLESGAIFRPITRHGKLKETRLRDRDVAELVKHYAAAAGFDAELYSGHSLRAGLITSVLDAGGTLYDAMRQSRHRSERVAKRYDRGRNLFRKNVVTMIGL